jgi:hypothetical protein
MHRLVFAALLGALFTNVHAAAPLPAAHAASAAVATARPAMPPLQLPDSRSHGQRAIDLLGDRLPEVAAQHGTTADMLKQRLLHDPHLQVDHEGRLLYTEPEQAPAPRTPPPPSPGLLDGTLAPLADTFKLHSRPGAHRVIYLDFNGATVSGTTWSGTTFVAPPFDTDGNPAAFSADELAMVQGIWQRVAEDYAPFEVDVTTEAPTSSSLTRGNTKDTDYGLTVVITNGSLSSTLCGGCGGIAYVGVFDEVGDQHKPAFVFHDRLLNVEKYIAEAASHETGHTLGLYHDGTATSPYFIGQGTGAEGWAPIMGLGYYQPVVQWSRSDYTQANNNQDELAVIQSHGLPQRADDHGDTPATATPLKAATLNGVPVLTAQGVIERTNDVDMFSFSALAGTVNVWALASARAPNLDVLLTLRDTAGAVLAVADPTDTLNASLTAVLPAAGTYYVTVQGTGRGDPLVDGFSSYGSLGAYSVTVQQP